MTYHIATADGNLTSSSTWGVVDSTSLLDSEAGSTAISTTPLSSSTFTPGAITVDGVALNMRARAASPVGTFSVTLRNNTDATDVVTVTVNVSDFPSGVNQGWQFFNFGSQTLLAGKAYLIKVVCSNTGSQVTLYRNATANNWSRMLRTTTTAAPGAGDDMHICGEKTAAATMTTRSITMDNTATTDFGSSTVAGFTVNDGGTLTWGTTGSTNYYLKLSTNLRVNQGAAWYRGSTGSEIPRTSTAVLEFDCASDGQYGETISDSTTVRDKGLSRTSGKDYTWCLLNTDEAAGQTTLGVDTNTGWLNGDDIAIAPTSRTRTHAETRTLNGNAGASSMDITAGLTNSHLGTSPAQAEVILLTRNVITRSANSSFMTYVNVSSGADVEFSWVEFRYLGTTTTGQRGLELNTTTGSAVVEYCSFRDFERYGIHITGSSADNYTIQYNVFYNCSQFSGTFPNIYQNSSSSSSNWLIDNNVIILSTCSYGIYTQNNSGTLTNNRVSGINGDGFFIDSIIDGTMNSNHSHSNGGQGFDFTGNIRSNANCGSLYGWNNGSYGVFIATGQNFTIDGGALFGNTTYNIYIDSGTIAGNLSGLVVNDMVLAASDDFSTTTNFGTDTLTNCTAQFNNCQFSPTTGYYAAATNDINIPSNTYSWIHQIELNNCTMGGTNEVNGQSNLGWSSWVKSNNHNQSATQHKQYYWNGTISCDTTNYGTASPGQTLDPSDATYKLKSGSILVPVDSGDSVTVGVGIKELNSYNGNDARLMVRRNDLLGISADTVVDTATAAPETLSGSVGPVSANGVLEFYVDCDGTVGEINVDDWTVSGAADDTGGQTYWYNGIPFPAIITPSAGGGGTRGYISFG